MSIDYNDLFVKNICLKKRSNKDHEEFMVKSFYEYLKIDTKTQNY